MLLGVGCWGAVQWLSDCRKWRQRLLCLTSSLNVHSALGRGGGHTLSKVCNSLLINWCLPTLRNTDSAQWPLPDWEFAILSRVAGLAGRLCCVVVVVVNILQSQSLRTVKQKPELSLRTVKQKLDLAGRCFLTLASVSAWVLTWRSQVSPFFVLTKLIIGHTWTVHHWVAVVIKIAYQSSITRWEQLNLGWSFQPAPRQIFDSWCHPTIFDHIMS